MYRVRSDRVFDGSDMHRDMVVSWDEGHIVGMEKHAEGPEYDLYVPDSTLMPGLIDTHVHLVWDYSQRPQDIVALERSERTVLRAVRHAQEHLAAGVTTIRDLGATGSLSVDVAQAIAAGDVPGPRVIPAGRAIAMTGGHGWTLCVEADGPDEVRRVTREELKRGARAIKLIASGGVYGKNERPENPQLGAAEVAAAIEEAHNAGVLVAGHAYAPEVIQMLLNAGVDSIEHGSLVDAACLSRMAELNVFLVPTLSVFDAIYSSTKGTDDTEIADKALEVRGQALASCQAASREGVPIAVGTDSGAPGCPHGSAAGEVALMVEAGMAELDALQACTRNAARAVGMEDSIGRVRQGYTADILIVRGNPLEEISALRDVERVFLGGSEVLVP